jgi:hypothetical protein
VGSSRYGSPYAEPDGADRRSAAVVVSKLGPARGLAREVGSGHVGRTRCTARRSGADMGLADGTPGGSRHACSSADLGLAGVSRCRPATARTRAGLGRTSGRSSVATATSRCTGSCVGWISRARTLRAAAAAARAGARPCVARTSTA